MKHILVAVDFSKQTQAVADQASALAKELGGKLWLIHVIANEQLKKIGYEASQFYYFAPEFLCEPVGDVERVRSECAAEYRREHQALLKLSGKMKKDGVDARAMLLKGEVAETILKKADELNIDMIVMGSHGHRALRKLLTGSITEAVLRKASCGVFIIPSRDPNTRTTTHANSQTNQEPLLY